MYRVLPMQVTTINIHLHKSAIYHKHINVDEYRIPTYTDIVIIKCVVTLWSINLAYFCYMPHKINQFVAKRKEKQNYFERVFSTAVNSVY